MYVACLVSENSYNFILYAALKDWGTLLVAQLVEALRHKSEDRGFDSRWCH